MNDQEQKQVTNLAQELGDDVNLVKQMIADYKAGGIKQVIANDSAALVREAQEDYAAIRQAMPALKAGYKTTEFWLIAGVIAGNVLYTSITGKVLPLDVNAIGAAMVTVYTVVRGAIKK